MSKPDLEQTERAWVIPILLGALLTVLSAWLVVIELAQPKSTATFRGIRFSNTINSAGARNTVYYFREQLDWLPRPFKDDFLSPTVYLANLRGIFIAMFLIQIAALILVRRGPLASPHLWAVGPAAACLALLLYPPTSTDIYAYASFGWVADEGSNPYTVVPKSILGDPYHTFNDWTHITTPYGPIWTWISQLLVHMSGQDPFWTTILFKLVATLSAFGLAYATLALAKRFTTDPRLQLTAFIYVLWSPILLFESAGPVHLDALMMLFAVTGLLVATGTKIRSPRLGLVIATGSALIKPATLPLLGLMGITRFNRADPWPIIIRRIAGDIVVVLATILLAYLAFIDSAFIHATDKMAHDVF
ncbi:MAG TPA: polyprenol phosphomannose-dependent alpha 1,6 mannosyltransferase MptB, partial [Thermomicrobiales bacterium]|nr:polyprenol phosphomannose-dependent alpha 1,6 mannosyltransferase MptB [Thermomicrobiales bacterium]